MRSISLSRRQALGSLASGTLLGLSGCGKAEPARPGALALAAVQSHVESINIYGSEAEFLKSFAAAPPRVGHLLAVFWCDAEVCNGGFDQFFLNSTGVLAPEAVLGFRAIGLPECADLVETAIGKFPPPYPRDRERRDRALNALSGSGPKGHEGNLFYDLEDLYYAARDRGKFDAVMDAYAQQLGT